MSASFSDRLAAAVDRCGSPVCVGLDPVLERLPKVVLESARDPLHAMGTFCLGVLTAAAGVAPAVKFQSACFERYLGPGVALLHDLIPKARELGYVVILDAKRGDIGVTAEHYAAATIAPSLVSAADAVTLNPYLGFDTIEPYLLPDRGVFILVRTSNPGSDLVQSARLSDDRTVSELIAAFVAQLGSARRGSAALSDVGAVVAATKPADAARLRAVMPDQIFLVPGYGAQGGTAADVHAMLRPEATSPGSSGVLVTASRSVIYAFELDTAPRDWRESVRVAATALARDVRAAIEPS